MATTKTQENVTADADAPAEHNATVRQGPAPADQTQLAGTYNQPGVSAEAEHTVCR